MGSGPLSRLRGSRDRQKPAAAPSSPRRVVPASLAPIETSTTDSEGAAFEENKPPSPLPYEAEIQRVLDELHRRHLRVDLSSAFGCVYIEARLENGAPSHFWEPFTFDTSRRGATNKPQSRVIGATVRLRAFMQHVLQPLSENPGEDAPPLPRAESNSIITRLKVAIQADPQLHLQRPHRQILAFKNGIYMTLLKRRNASGNPRYTIQDEFIPWANTARWQALPPAASLVQHDVSPLALSCDDAMDISTPALQSILHYHCLSQDVQRWVYILLGRELHWQRPIDHWGRGKLWISGEKRTGAKVFGKVAKRFRELVAAKGRAIWTDPGKGSASVVAGTVEYLEMSDHETEHLPRAGQIVLSHPLPSHIASTASKVLSEELPALLVKCNRMYLAEAKGGGSRKLSQRLPAAMGHAEYIDFSLFEASSSGAGAASSHSLSFAESTTVGYPADTVAAAVAAATAPSLSSLHGAAAAAHAWTPNDKVAAAGRCTHMPWPLPVMSCGTRCNACNEALGLIPALPPSRSRAANG